MPTQSQPREAARNPFSMLSMSAIRGARNSTLARWIRSSNLPLRAWTCGGINRDHIGTGRPDSLNLLHPGVMYTELSGKVHFHNPRSRHRGSDDAPPDMSWLSRRTPTAPLRSEASATAAMTSGSRMGEPGGAEPKRCLDPEPHWTATHAPGSPLGRMTPQRGASGAGTEVYSEAVQARAAGAPQTDLSQQAVAPRQAALQRCPRLPSLVRQRIPKRAASEDSCAGARIH